MIYSINGQKFDSDFLEHHGILGQKWGIRRFQNKDGSYTEAGKQRRNEAGQSAKKEKAQQEAKLLARWSADDFDPDHNDQDMEVVNVYKKVRDEIFNWYEHTPDDPKTHTSEMTRLVKETDAVADNYQRLSNKARKEADEAEPDWSGDGFSRYLKKQKEIMAKNGGEKAGKKLESLRKKIDAQVLRELGYEVTEENMKRIRPIWNWD